MFTIYILVQIYPRYFHYNQAYISHKVSSYHHLNKNFYFYFSKKNKKKEKQKLSNNVNDAINPAEGESISLQNIKLAMESIKFLQKPAKTTEEAAHKQYQFWSTQPVPKMGIAFFYYPKSFYLYIWFLTLNFYESK